MYDYQIVYLRLFQSRDPVLTETSGSRSAFSFPGYLAFGSAGDQQALQMEVTTNIPTTVDEEGIDIKEEDEVNNYILKKISKGLCHERDRAL